MRKTVRYDYDTQTAGDSAFREVNTVNATVIVGTDKHTLALVGNYDRFRQLRDLLNELLEDWE